MRRGVAVTALTGLTLFLVTATAQAKPEHGSDVSGQAVITGPGLDSPIVLEGQFGQETAFERLVVGAGVIPSDVGYYGLDPDHEKIGPRYGVVYTFEVDSTAEVTTIRQELYPFADEGPLFFSEPGQSSLFSSRGPGPWWHAPASVLPLLIAHGLPSVPPRVAPAPEAQPRPPGAAPTGSRVDASRIWIGLAAMTGLAALLVLGTRAGRRGETVAS